MQVSTGDIITVGLFLAGIVGGGVALLVRALVLDRVGRLEKTARNFGERLGGHDTAIAVLNDFRDRVELAAPRRRMTLPPADLPDEPSK